MNKLDAVVNKLKNFKNRLYNQEEEDEISEILLKLKEYFVGLDDQENAKEIWRLHTIKLIQRYYINALKCMKKKQFYEGWCFFELSEKNLEYLSEHFNLEESGDQFFLALIKKQVKQFQELYPDYWFHSTGIIVKTSRCSICNEIITPRNHCGHELCKIYNGLRCVRIPQDFELDHDAITKYPYWKYRVLFEKNEDTGESIDTYDYSIVNYLIELILNHFEDWNYKWEENSFPYSKFKDLKNEDYCPCLSGKRYLECCAEKEEILMTFIEFWMDPTKIYRYQTKPKSSYKNGLKQGTYSTVMVKTELFFIDY